jgi:short-subunit dehydrogenase
VTTAGATQAVVVTGASSGIGEALARAWARRGATLVLSARDEVGLARVARAVEAAGGRAIGVPADLTREQDRVQLVERARAEAGKIDVLVNNAGRGYYGSVARIGPHDLEALFALNVVAPLHLAQLALEAISMSLRAELAGTGVRVIVVRPGPVDTGFREHAVVTDGRAGVRPRGADAQSPDEVADQTLRAVDRGQSVLETTAFVRLASAAARIAPGAMRWVTAAMAARN